MKNKKVGKIVTLSIIGLLVLIAVIVFVLNFTGDDSKLSILEKKWLSDNANKVIDIDVFNDIPVYGSSGNGVIFDFLDDFTEDYDIVFNKISYSKDDTEKTYGDLSFKVLNNSEDISSNQILFYKDSYVLLGSSEDSVLTDISLVDGNIGIISSDKEDISYYLNISDNIKTYDNIEDMLKGYENKEVSYLILPNMMYMDTIVSNSLSILYHISDISKKYVLEVSDSSLYSIMNKYYNDFLLNDYSDSFGNNFLSVYFDNTSYSDADKVNYNSSMYTYGYVINMPYENIDNNKFVGIISNYLKEFQDIAKIDLKVVKYDSLDELKNALISGDVDFALGNFDVSSLGSSFVSTNSFINSDYVVISKEYQNIGSIAGLKNIEVSVIGNSKLDNLLNSKSISVKQYNDTDDLLRNIADDSVVAIDDSTYQYYRDGKLKNYKVIYEDSLDGYSFVMSNKNEVFVSLLSYYVSFKDYNDWKYQYNTSINIHNNNGMEVLYIVIFCLALVIILSLIGIIIRNKRNKKIRVGVDDKAKYIDVMTSLKNRNYLNYSIPMWDENVIYPQAIIVIDLNNIQTINDTYGHEKGDEVIKKAANILIANQLEKTDLVRTDGNEFLIYMVGYSTKDVLTYAKKIYKEFKGLPYGYGGSIGYSMIEDDVKTIDDAINEAMIDMNKNKENEKK